MSDSLFMVFQHQSSGETEKPLSDPGLVEIAAETHRKPGALTDQQTAHKHTHSIALPLLHVHYLAMQSYQYPGHYGFIVGINL